MRSVEGSEASIAIARCLLARGGNLPAEFVDAWWASVARSTVHHHLWVEKIALHGLPYLQGARVGTTVSLAQWVRAHGADVPILGSYLLCRSCRPWQAKGTRSNASVPLQRGTARCWPYHHVIRTGENPEAPRPYPTTHARTNVEIDTVLVQDWNEVGDGGIRLLPHPFSRALTSGA